MATTIQDIEALVAQSCVVEVETGVGSGLFVPTADWQVVRVVRAADGQDESALLRSVSSAAEACARHAPQRRISIRARHGAAHRYLFCGCPRYIEWQADASGDVPREQGLLHVEGIAAALRRQADLVVIGRHARTREGWSPAGDGDRIALQRGLPCVFSPAGKPNSAVSPVPVRLREGDAQEIHVFTHEDDPQAQPWTFGSCPDSGE